MGFVVIIDDDDITLKILSKYMSNTYPNLRISVFGDPKKALDFIKNNPVDLVVTDNMMPDINGIDVLRAVKEIDKNINVIIMSSFMGVDRYIDAKHFKVNAIISKPFINMKEVAGIINRFARKKN